MSSSTPRISSVPGPDFFGRPTRPVVCRGSLLAGTLSMSPRASSSLPRVLPKIVRAPLLSVFSFPLRSGFSPKRSFVVRGLDFPS